LQARAHTTVGSVSGPITCPTVALQQTNSAAPCYGAKASNDSFDPNSVGADLTTAVTPGGGRFTFYGGGGDAHLPAPLHVGFTDRSGFTDRTLVEAGLSRESVFGGLSFRIFSSLSAAAEVYSVPADVTTVRLSASYHL